MEQKLNWGDQVVILKMFRGPNQYADIGARWWGTWPGNSKNAGKMRVMCDGVEIAVEKERIMRYDEYMKRYHEGTLPPDAAGKPWFLND